MLDFGGGRRKTLCDKYLTVGYHTSPWMVAEFTVASSSNGEPLSTRSARNHSGQSERGAGSVIVKLVKAGQVIYPREVDLQTLFDLSGGTYTVVAVMQLPIPESPKRSIPVHSNPITISIVGK